MAMRVEKTVPALGREVRVFELTVSEIRAWLAGAIEGDVDVVDQLLFEDVSLTELRKFTDLTEAEVDAAAPSELRAIKDFCKEVNRDFFVLRSRLMSVGAGALSSASSS